MFFKKFFSKNFQQLLEKADSLYKDEHYSEARLCYHDALEKNSGTDSLQQDIAHIHSRIKSCGNLLAEMNIREAEAAIRAGNAQKAAEYLELSLEQADDVSVREKAEIIIASLSVHTSPATHKVESAGKHGCSSCSPSKHATPAPGMILPDHLHSHEQFQLLVNTLPGDLPQRYGSLGEEFADAYLLAHSEDSSKALNKFRQLLSTGDNDIILYETAILEYKDGRIDVCESLLRKALQIKSDNAVCNLSLAQLFADTGRLTEAASQLKSMMERMILREHCQIMLADIYLLQGDQEGSVALLSEGLENPLIKKASAERLVPILASQGRDSEAAYLVKTYLKGCC